MSYYGQIDLTKLGKVVKEHPEAIREAQFKDGVHKFVNIEVKEKQAPDQWGNIAYAKVGIKKEQQKDSLNYFVADLKKSNFDSAPVQEQPQRQAAPSVGNDKEDLPF